MTWERYASVLYAFYLVFGDFRSKLEVHMHVSYADFYELLRIFAVLCAKLPDVPTNS
jgi:methionine synthase II (cobalamin-independent)